MSNMNASIFQHSSGTSSEFIKCAYRFLIIAYTQLINNNYVAGNENNIRDNLVKLAKKNKDYNLPFRWITEFPDIERNNRIDIDLATPASLKDDSLAIKIECKIVGEDKYIDTTKSFARIESPTNGIMSFITGKYSPEMCLAGMIGFIKTGNINEKILKLKWRLDNHNDIKTTKNVTTYTLIDNFDYSYMSEHERVNLPNIGLYHLFFDFTQKQ
ncbi:MAG: hypothetical protein KAS17_00795 [Victivallaceae bacterium]|nr:hypothetical protein [Victivallaceae bacterium]